MFTGIQVEPLIFGYTWIQVQMRKCANIAG